MRKILLGLVPIIALVFMLNGCMSSSPTPSKTTLGTNTASPKVAKLIKEHNLQVVDKEYVRSRLGKGTKNTAHAILVDSRPAKKFASKTIPSSINIPDTHFDKYIGQLDGVAKDREIIVYCGGWACAKSPKVAVWLQKRGFTNVKLYQAGEPEWSKEVYAEVGTPIVNAAMKKNSALIVDARPYSKFLGATIPGAIAIPDTKMSELEGRFPADKNTQIIVFCGGYECTKSHIVTNRLLELGYKNVAVYAGGFPAWKKAGLRTTGGGAKPKPKAASTKTSPFLGPIKKGEDVGSVDGAWFIANYQNLPKGVTVVDVRGSGERKSGSFKGSKHVSIEENKPADFMAKLPKDGYVILHCSAGGRSIEAYELLKDNKYKMMDKVVYLDANINCKGNSCTIKPNDPLDPTNW